MDLDNVLKVLDSEWKLKKELKKPSFLLATDEQKNMYVTVRDDSTINTYSLIEKDNSRIFMIPAKYTEVIEDKIYYINNPSKLLPIQCNSSLDSSEITSNTHVSEEHKFVNNVLAPIVREKYIKK